MPKVSVLIAVYNAEATLNKCLNSLLSQTYTDLDILCVDDASTDSSSDILKHYATQDLRVHILHHTVNKGAPSARNLALKHAEGDLICFLDSDDWLAPDAIKKCVDVFSKDPETDSVLFNVTIYDEEQQREEPYPIPTSETLISGKEAFRLSLDWQLHGIYMIKAAIHQRIPYDDSCRLFSDDNTTRLHYLASRKVGTCKGTYYYRRHNHSATHIVSAKRYQYINAISHLAEQLKQYDVEEEDLHACETARWRILVDTYMFHFCHRRQLTKEERMHGLQTIRSEWQAIKKEWIAPMLRRKFGYMPFKHSWTFFRWQEEIYFFLRSLLGKNRY